MKGLVTGNSSSHGILLIVGRAGAGKTTIAERMSSWFPVKILTFSSLVRLFARSNGFSQLRDYYVTSDAEIFKKNLNVFLYTKISAQLKQQESLIIEGMISHEVINKIKKEVQKFFVAHIDVPRNIRLLRISNRLKCSHEKAVFEEEIKENMKESLGMSRVLKESNLTVDGLLPLSISFP